MSSRFLLFSLFFLPSYPQFSMQDSSMEDAEISMEDSSSINLQTLGSTSSNPTKTEEPALTEHRYIRKREFMKNLLSFLTQNFTYLSSIIAIISHTSLKTFHDENFTAICFLILMLHLVYATTMFLFVEDNMDVLVGRSMVCTIFLMVLAFISSSIMLCIVTPRLVIACATFWILALIRLYRKSGLSLMKKNGNFQSLGSKKIEEPALTEHPYVRNRDMMKNLISFVAQNFTYISTIVGIISHTTLEKFRDENFTFICFLILILHFVYSTTMFLFIEDNLDIMVGRSRVATIFFMVLTFLSSSIMFWILTSMLVMACASFWILALICLFRKEVHGFIVQKWDSLHANCSACGIYICSCFGRLKRQRT